MKEDAMKDATTLVSNSVLSAVNQGTQVSNAYTI